MPDYNSGRSPITYYEVFFDSDAQEQFMEASEFLGKNSLNLSTLPLIWARSTRTAVEGKRLSEHIRSLGSKVGDTPLAGRFAKLYTEAISKEIALDDLIKAYHRAHPKARAGIKAEIDIQSFLYQRVLFGLEKETERFIDIRDQIKRGEKPYFGSEAMGTAVGISVFYRTGPNSYTWTVENVGQGTIDEMIFRGEYGRGLNSFINKNVKYSFSR